MPDAARGGAESGDIKKESGHEARILEEAWMDQLGGDPSCVGVFSLSTGSADGFDLFC